MKRAIYSDITADSKPSKEKETMRVTKRENLPPTQLIHLTPDSSCYENQKESKMKKPLKRSVIAQIDDADFGDCTATGYSWILYTDGSVAAVYHSRWQGSRSGARFATGPGYVPVAPDVDADEDNDHEARPTSAVQGLDPECDDGWRQTRRGWIVQ